MSTWLLLRTGGKIPLSNERGKVSVCFGGLLIDGFLSPRYGQVSTFVPIGVSSIIKTKL